MNAARARWYWCGLAGVLALWGAWLATRGASDPLIGVIAWINAWNAGGTSGLVWVLGAVGLGRLLDPRGPWARSAAMGCGAALWLAHLTGIIGGFAGVSGMFLAWVAPLVGIGVLVQRWRQSRAGPRAPASTGTITPSWTPILAAACVAPAVGVLLVAPMIPPGTIWAGEANGYDALSYHLALPKEWLERGRIMPLEFNAYSWLPSYLESAFTQVGAMLGAGARTEALHAGNWLVGAQALHAAMGLVAAWVVAAFASTILQRSREGSPQHRSPAVFASAAMAASPWTMATGSLAYTEMGMLLGLGGAMLACATPEPGEDASARPRGVRIGFLLGIATMCKPTAAFMGAPAVVLGALSYVPRRQWTGVLIGTLIGGAVASLPWIVRNGIAGGNPVFPYLTGVFGTGHWDGAMVARWMGEHHPARSLGERLDRLVGDAGLLHPYWITWASGAVLACAVLLVAGRTRRAGWPLAVSLLAQLSAWTLLGHQQARFLIPVLVPGGAAIALAAGAFAGRAVQRGATLAACALGLALSITSVREFLRQNRAEPCAAIEAGVPMITGLAMEEELERIAPTPDERATALERLGNPIAAANLLFPRSAGADPVRLYLLGEARSLYYCVPLLWNTTWDRWPLREAVRRGGGPIEWGEYLRSLGVTHVYVNFPELARLRESGYSPPEMTPELCARFVTGACDAVVRWPATGVGLFRLRDAGP